jgi:hypothetical protein
MRPGVSAGGFADKTARSRLKFGAARRAAPTLGISIRVHLPAFAGCSQTAEDCRCYNAPLSVSLCLRERLTLGPLFPFGKCVSSRFLRDSAIVTPCGEGAADEVRASNPKFIIPHPVNSEIDSFPLTLRAAFCSLSPLRSDSFKKMLAESTIQYSDMCDSFH